MTKALIVFIFVLLVVAAVLFQGRQYKKFLAGAAKTTGRITTKEERLKRADHPNRKDFFISYSYIVDGTQYNGQDNVEYPDLWQSMEVGQEIGVYYSKANPAISHPAMLLDRRLKLSF